MQRVKNFAEYLWLLLPSGLKQIGKRDASWWIFCRVIGRRFDALKEMILDLREMALLLACPEELLPTIGQDRQMPRLRGEVLSQYRRRLTMKLPISEMAGTNTGIRWLMKSFGYEDAIIEPTYQTDQSKWAEATVWITGGTLVIDDRAIIQQELNRIKPASALLHLMQEEHQYGRIYLGAYLETTQVIDLWEV